MRLLLAFIVLPFFLIMTEKSYADSTPDNDSLYYDDSESVTRESVKDTTYDIIATGGLGLSDGTSFFSISPSLGMGLEIPFTRSHRFAFEMYGHCWINKSNGEISDSYKDGYISLSNNTYSGMGLSTVVKFYVLKKSSLINLSLHFGWMIISPGDDYKSIDLGYSLYYKINNNCSVSFCNRFLTGIPTVDGHSDLTPNLFMINLNYKIWRL